MKKMRLRIAHLLEPATRSIAAQIVHGIHIAVIVGGVIGVILISDPNYQSFTPLLLIPLFIFALEYLCRLWIAPELMMQEHLRGVRRRWVISALGVVDGLAVIAIPAAWLLKVPHGQAELLGIFWVFKLARYSQGLEVLGRVIHLEAEPLTGVLFAFMVILLGAAVLIHLLEGQAQPAAFGNVPQALWWTIVTVTTTGYGDVTPQTLAGRMFAGLVMMSGIVVFALWAAILANGFSQEMRRRAFLKTWDLVAQVPLFHNVGATVISEVAQRLRRREVTAGSVVLRKGEIGDCMYFIVSGEVSIDIGSRLVTLHDGAFFGELALITGDRRSATATATSTTQLLMLDIADFRDLAARHPELASAIHDEADRRLNQHRDFVSK